MKISTKIQDAMNKQIAEELSSCYVYLSMAAYFEEKSLKGFASWMRKQSAEEQVHAMKIFDFVIDRGGQVKLAALPAPKSGWKSPLEAFKDAYAHELKITALIHKLQELSASEKDHASFEFLNWYVKEQVEEEANASFVVDKLTMSGDDSSAILMLDHELGKRD